jgi:hypothetical protein
MSFSLCDIHRCPLYGRFQEAQRTSAQRVIRSAEPVNLARLIDEVIGTAGQLAEKNQNRLIVEARGGCVIRFSHPYRDLDVECETHIGGPWNDWVRLKYEMTNYWTGEPLAIDDKIFLATSRPPNEGRLRTFWHGQDDGQELAAWELFNNFISVWGTPLPPAWLAADQPSPRDQIAMAVAS